MQSVSAQKRNGRPPSIRQPFLDDTPPYPSHSPSYTDIPSPSPSLLTPPTTPTPSPAPSIWLIYACSLLAMLIGGTSYCFSSWAPDLKARLSYTQSELELVGYFGNWPGLVQPLVGVLVNRYPPSVTAVLGAVFLLCGYLGLALGVSGWADWVGHPGVMAAANASVIVGVTFIYTVCISVNVLNLPPHRMGGGISVLVTFYGLSASIFSLLYVYVLQSNLFRYFIMAGLLSASLCLLNAVTLKKVTGVNPPSLTPLLDNPPLPESPSSSPRSPASDSSLKSLSFSSSPSQLHLIPAEDVVHPVTSDEVEGDEWDVGLADGSLLSVFRVLWYMMRGWSFYAFFSVMFLVGGCGYMTINNTGGIVESLNGGQADREFTFVCILILSLGNGLGRLLMSISDFVPIRRGWFAVMSASLMLAVYTRDFFLVSVKEDWLLSAFFTGLSYGSCWAIIPILTAETWPRSLFGISWGWIASAPSLASLCFNAVVGVLYDSQADASHNCVGKGCWSTTFAMGIGSASVGLLVSVALVGWTAVGKKKRRKATLGEEEMEKAAYKDIS